MIRRLLLAAMLLLAGPALAQAPSPILQGGAMTWQYNDPTTQRTQAWTAHVENNGDLGFLDTGGHNVDIPLAAGSVGSVVDVRQFGAKCDGVTDDTNAIQKALSSAWAGAFVYGPAGGTCKISQTLFVGQSFVSFGTLAGPATAHDSGPNGQGNLRLSWAGGASPMMIVAPVTGATQTLTGNVVRGVSFLCNSAATIGLLAEGVRSGKFSVYAEECTTAGVETNGSPVATGENGDFLDNDLQVNGLQAANAAPILWMTGNANGNSDYNRVVSAGNFKNADGLLIGDADNNTFFSARFFQNPGGSGSVYGVDCAEATTGTCRSNTFIQLSSTSIFRGTDTQATATQFNIIYSVDDTNSTAQPIVGTGAGVYWQRQSGAVLNPPYGAAFVGVPASNTPGLVATEQFGNLTGIKADAATWGLSTSLYDFNGSQGPLAFFSDNTNRWRLRFNGTAFILERVSGSLPFEVSPGVQLAPTQVGLLPTCNAGAEGTHAAVTDDATAVSWGAAVTGGGSSHVAVYCDGSSWKVYAQ